MLVGSATLVLLVVLTRTRIAAYASVIALVLPSLLALALPAVATVADVGAIPTGIPLPSLPPLHMLFSADVLTGALVVAVIVLVQGAGVSEAAPNPDGAPPDIDADFRAQGIGNIAAALFRGQPVGGSVGQTALNAAAGARTRWRRSSRASGCSPSSSRSRGSWGTSRCPRWAPSSSSRP